MTSFDIDDIEAAHIVNARSDGSTSHSTAASVAVKTEPIILVKFRCRQLRDSVVRQRRLLKGTGMTIVEDLTSLNVKTLNRVRNSDLVATSWTWNGRIFALLKSGKKVIVKPFQPLQDCDAVTV